MQNERERTLLLFEDLVARHTDLVFHVACSWAGDAGQAEELTQTGFIKAWNAFDQFKPGTNFKAWILKILRNAFIDHQRSLARRPSPLSIGDIPPDWEPVVKPPPPETIDFENREIFYDLFGDEIARLLRKLPQEFQLAVLLCDVEGLAYQEIADVLVLPMGTVRSRIHRGRALLSELLQDYAKKLGYIREPES